MFDLDSREVYITRHSLSSHLTVFCFWPFTFHWCNSIRPKSHTKRKTALQHHQGWPPGTLANFAFLSYMQMFISEGWIWSHRVLRTAQHWQCKVHLSGRKASFHFMTWVAQQMKDLCHANIPPLHSIVPFRSRLSFLSWLSRPVDA